MNINYTSTKQLLSKTRRPKVVPYYLGHFLIYLGVLIVTLVIGWLAIKSVRIYSSYQAINQYQDTLETLASNEQILSLPSLEGDKKNDDLNQFRDNLRGLATELETLSEELQPFLPLTPYLGWVPVYGSDLQATPYLVNAGRDSSQIGLTLFEALVAVLEPGPRGQQEVIPYTAARLVATKIDLEQAAIQLRQHQAIIAEFEPDHFSPKTAGRVDQLKQYLSQLISGLQLMQQVPLLLGSESPQTYLILTQNSDELRPSGGYINAAGHIIFDQGQISEFVMQDSYAIDQISETYPYPPDPLYEFMAADYWVLRDAGWSPDFPTTARTALNLYERGQGVSAKGVIALDQRGIAYLLRAVEAVDVEGERVTADNVIELMRRHWGPEPGQNLDGTWWLQRKSFMLALAETIRHKFEQDPEAVNLSKLVEAMRQAAAEKHLLIYLEDPALTGPGLKKRWAGSLHRKPGDYLMVVDANVGFNKANALVDRYLSYRITLAEDGSAQAHAQLVYQHQARKSSKQCSKELRYNPVYEQNTERCYWNYYRLVVPATAQLISGPNIVVDGQYLLRGHSTTGQIDVTPEGPNRKSWGQLFLLAPQETISLDYVYDLPAGAAWPIQNQWVYQLDLQKQPGNLAPPAEIVITLPEGARLLNSQPRPLSQQGAAITYQLTLETDRSIQISYTLR